MITPGTFDLKTYLFCLVLFVITCGLFVISNYIITSKITLLTNQAIGRADRKGNAAILWYSLLVVTSLVVPLGGKNPIVMVATFFVLSSSNLLSFSRSCLVLGSEKYLEDTKRYYVETASWRFWTIILLKLIPVYIVGLLVGIAGEAGTDNRFWYLKGIGIGISFYALLAAFSDAYLRLKYKHEAKKAVV